MPDETQVYGAQKQKNDTQGSCWLQHGRGKVRNKQTNHIASEEVKSEKTVKMMKVLKAVFENRCSKPVYVYGSRNGVFTNQRIAPRTTEVFTESRGFVPWREERITVSFLNFTNGRQRPTNLDASVIELNANYSTFVVPKAHISFISQLQYSDLNLEVALWKDVVDGDLAVEGGNPACFSRAKTAFSVSSCSFPDGSGKIVNRSWGRICMPVCAATNQASEEPCINSCYTKPGKPVEYARYASYQTLAYRRGQWRQSPATVDLHQRECDQQWSANFECWDNQAGPEGFPICDGPDARELPDVLGAWQVVACPDAPSMNCISQNLSSTCESNIKWAIQTGIFEQPLLYPGLSPTSSKTEFQWAIHDATGKCPEPCTPTKNILPAVKCAGLSKRCVDAVNWAQDYGLYMYPEWYPGLTPRSPREEFQHILHAVWGSCPEPKFNASVACNDLSTECLLDLKWAMTTGIYQHPEWYLGLTPKSPLSDFQRIIYNAKGSCPEPCSLEGVKVAADTLVG